MRSPLLQGCSSLLAASGEKYYFPGQHVFSSNKWFDIPLDGFLATGRVRRMVKVTHYIMFFVVLRFLTWTSARRPRLIEEATLTNNFVYLVLIEWWVWQEIMAALNRLKRKATVALEYHVNGFNSAFARTFSIYFCSVIYKLNLHLLDHIVDGLQALVHSL